MTNTLWMSAHNMVETSTASRMSAPPMVGVPAFLWCVCGPSARMTWPICLLCSRRMNQGARKKQIIMDVSVAMMMRKGT
jgi:hypothetical protein